MAQVIYPNTDGQILLYDNSVIYVVDFEYSADGKTYWEKHFKSTEHEYEYDNTIIVQAHKYIRFKRAGSTTFDAPAKFIGDNGVDGDNIEMQVTVGKLLQYKLTTSTIWTTLYDLNELKGEQGPMGQGWAIDDVGPLDLRTSCCGTLPISSCIPCNANSVASASAVSTFLSLGNHRITTDDVLNGTTYWHSLDGVTWIQTTDTNVGEYVTAWQATAIAGTDALSCNNQGYEVAFASLVTPYISKGRVYVCAAGMWTEVLNIVTPTGYVKTSANDGLQFLESKMDDTTLEAYDSGVGYNDNIRIKDDGVNEYKIISTTIGDGLDGGSGDIITVDPTDIIGFGLREYTSTTDSLEDIQVFVDDVIGDGLISFDDTLNQADGEDRNLARVNVDDIISPTTAVFTGLQTSTDAGIVETDTFDNIYIKPGDCLLIDVDGVNVVGDGLTVATDGLSEAIVPLTDSNTLGIQAKHLHANTVNTNKGLQKDGLTIGSLEVKPDTTRGSIGFNGTGEIHVPDNGIQGLHLNDNTCDNTKGAEIITDKIVVKIDGTTVEFNGSGELQVVEAYIQGLIDAGVATLVVPGEAAMVGDIIFNASNSNGLISLVVAGSGATDGTVTFTTDVDESALTTFITNVVNSIVTDASTYERLKDILVAGAGITLTNNDATSKMTIASTASVPVAGSTETLDGTKADGTDVTYARSDHKHDVSDGALTIAKTSGLQGALDNKIALNTAYGNGQLATSGLLVQSPNGNWFQLQVNDNGDLDTRKV